MGRGGLLHAVGRNSREAAAWRLGPAWLVAWSPCTVRASGATLDGGAVGLADGKVLLASTSGVSGWHWARRSAAGLTQSAGRRGGGAVGRRSAVAVHGSGAGTVVADDGALALQQGRERVR
jgi:hypothetical protein